MSRTIDEKVVEMRFDNRDFERNVSQSMSTLDKLKNSLNFDGAANAFSGISAAANKLDFSSLSGAIEGVGEKFSALETIAVGALLNIGGKISDLAMKTVKELTFDQFTAGLDKYGNKTKSVQTIMNATGKSIEEVSDQLDRLMWFTDETSYDFVEMSNSIGKFTSAGIDLETAVTSMEGIANWAAVSGAGKNEANRAMYNISQALSAGYMRLADWKSIENANMATKEFKEMAIEAGLKLGTLATDMETGLLYAIDEEGNLMDPDHNVDFKTFGETLTKGKWFTTEVLTSVLDKYGKFTDELSRVYDDITSQEGIDITTSQIIKMANQYAEGTLDMQQAMAMTGLTADELTEKLGYLASEEFKLGRKAFAAAQEAKTFEEAIDATKDAVSSQWMATFEILFGNYEEAKVLWTDLANELWEIFAGPLSDMNDMLSAWKNLKVGGREDFIEGIKNIYRAIRSVTDPISEAWETIFPAMTFERLGELVAGFKNFTESLILSEEKTKILVNGFEGIFRAIRIVKDGIGGLAGAFLSGYSGGIGKFFDGIFTGFKNATDRINDFIVGIYRVKGVLDDYRSGNIGDYGIVRDQLEAYPVAAKLVDIYEKFEATLKRVGEEAAKLIDLKRAIQIFSDEGGGIAGITKVISSDLIGILGTIGDIVKVWTGADISNWLDPIASGIRTVQELVTKLEEEVQKVIASILDEFKSVADTGLFDTIKEDLTGVAKAFSETFGPGFKETFGYVFDALKYIAEDWIKSFSGLIGEGSISLEGFFRTIDDGLLSIQNFIRTNETLASVMGGIKDAIKMIADFAKNFLSIRQVIDTYKAAGGGVAGVIEVINSKLKLIFDLVGNLIKRFTGIDISGVGDGILLVIKSIEEGVIRFADRIAKMLGWENNPFHEFLESSESTFGKLQALIGKFTGVDVGGINTFGEKLKGAFTPLGGIFTGFGKVLGGVWAVVQATIPLIGGALNWFGDLLLNLAEKIKGMTFGDILSIIRIILTIKKITNLQKLFGGISDTLDKLGDVLKSWQTKLRAEAMMAIAAAILMVAGALFAISLIPTENLIWAIGAVAFALAALTASILLIFASLQGFFKMTAIANVKAVVSFIGVLAAFAKVVMDVALAIGIIVVAIKILAGVQNALQAINNLKNMLTAIVVSLIAVMVAAKILKADMKDMAAIGSSILLVATALGVLAIVLKLFDKVDWSSIGKMAVAFGALAGITVGMIALIDLFDFLSGSITKLDKVGKGMLSMAAALGVLVGVLYLLDKVPFLTLLTSVVKLGVSLAALAYMAIFMNTFSDALSHFTKNLLNLGKALLYIGIGVAILGVIGKIIGDSAQEIADAAVDLLVTVMDAIVARTDEIVEDLLLFIEGVLRGLADHIPEIVSLCVEILAGIFKGVREALAQGDVSGLDLAAGTGLLGGLIGIVILLKKSKVDGKDFLKAAIALAGAAILLFEIGTFFAAFGFVADAVGATDAIKSFGETAAAMAEALAGGSGGVLLLFTTLLAFVVLYAKFRKQLPDSDDIFNSFGDVALIVLAVTSLVGELGVLFTATGAIFELVNSFTGDKGAFTDKEGNTYTGALGWIKQAGEFFTAIADIFREDAGIGALFTVIAGLMVLVNKLGFSSSGGSGDAFGNIVVIIAEVVGIIDALGILLGATGAILDLIDYGAQSAFGEQKSVIGWVEKAGEFFQAIGEAVGKLIGGLAGGLIEGTTEHLTEDMINILKGLGDVLLVMSEASFISGISLFTGGPIGLAVVGSELGGLAPGFRDFCDQIKDIPADIADKALVCAEALKYLIEASPKEGGLVQWITGHVDLEKFGSGLALLGAGLMGYQTAISGLDSQLIEDTKNSVATVIEMTKSIPKNGNGLYEWINGKTDLGDFGVGLTALGGGLLGYSLAISGINADVIEDTKTAVATVIELASAVPNTAETTWFWGLFKSKETSGIANFGDNLKSFAQGLVDYSNTITGLKTVLITNTSSSLKGVVEIAQNVSKLKEDQRTNITGSAKAIASLGENFKKYYDNVKDIDTQKVHLVNVQLEELIDAFSEMTEDFSKNVTTFGTSIVSTLAKAIKSEVSVGIIYDAVDNLLGSMNIRMNSVINGSVKGKNGTSVYGERIIQRLIIGLNNEEKRKLLSDAVIGVVNSIGTVLSDESEGFSENGAKLLEALGTGLSNTDAIDLIRQMFIDFFEGILNDISAKYEEFEQAGIDAINKITAGASSVDVEAAGSDVGENMIMGAAKGVEETAHVAIEAVKKVSGQMLAASKEVLQEKSPSKAMEEVGRYFNEGLEFGILGSIDGPVNAARDVASGAENVVRDVLGIHSKSRLMDLIGKFFDEGFASGIIENIPMVKTAVSSLLGAVQDGVGGDQLIGMIQSFGLSIPDTMISSIKEAASDPVEYGDLFGESLFGGNLNNLAGVLGMDEMQSYLSGEFQGMFSEAGYSGLDGVSGYLNAETGEAITQDFVIDGMCGNLNTYKDYAHDCYGEIAESGVDGVLDVFADKADGLSDMTIQGPTVTLVADTSQVDEAFDGLTHFHGETFQTNGELDAFLLAFDNMDSNKQLNFLTQYAEHGNTDMANYLQRRRSGIEGQEYSDQLFYDNVQQTASEISRNQQESHDLLMARLEETNANLLRIHEELVAFRGDVSEFDDMQVVLDTGTLVGEMTPYIDEKLNNRRIIGGRMVVT